MARVEFREPCIDFGQEHEPFNGLFEGDIRWQLLDHVLDLIADGLVRHTHILRPCSRCVSAPYLIPKT